MEPYRPLQYCFVLVGLAMIIGIVLVSANAVQPITACWTTSATDAIEETFVLGRGKSVRIPEDTRLLPHSDEVIGGIDYLRVYSEYGRLLVPKEAVAMERAEIPFGTRLSWVLGYQLTSTLQGLAMWHDNQSYLWVEYAIPGDYYGNVKWFLVFTWGAVFFLLVALRVAKYDNDLKTQQAKWWAFFLFMIPFAGLLNLALWYLFFAKNGIHFFAALSGVAINVMLVSLATIHCRTLRDETWRHRLVALTLSILLVVAMRIAIGGDAPIWRLVLLSGPIGVSYLAAEDMFGRFIGEYLMYWGR